MAMFILAQTGTMEASNILWLLLFDMHLTMTGVACDAVPLGEWSGRPIEVPEGTSRHPLTIAAYNKRGG